MDICMTFTGNMGWAMDINIGLVRHGLWTLTWTSSWPQVVAQATSLSTVPGATQSTDINMASGYSSDYRLPLSIQQ